MNPGIHQSSGIKTKAAIIPAAAALLLSGKILVGFEHPGTGPMTALPSGISGLSPTLTALLSFKSLREFFRNTGKNSVALSHMWSMIESSNSVLNPTNAVNDRVIDFGDPFDSIAATLPSYSPNHSISRHADQLPTILRTPAGFSNHLLYRTPAAKFTNVNDDENSIEDEFINNQDEIIPGSSYSSETRFDHLGSSPDHQIRQSRITKLKPKDNQCSICKRVFFL